MTRLDDYRLAREAQTIRAETASRGWGTETKAFYRDFDTAATDNSEAPLTWKAWLADAAGENDETRARLDMADMVPTVALGDWDQIAAVKDLKTRMLLSTVYLAELQAAIATVAEHRADGMRALRLQGHSVRAIAPMVGISPAQVQNVVCPKRKASK